MWVTTELMASGSPDRPRPLGRRSRPDRKPAAPSGFLHPRSLRTPTSPWGRDCKWPTRSASTSKGGGRGVQGRGLGVGRWGRELGGPTQPAARDRPPARSPRLWAPRGPLGSGSTPTPPTPVRLPEGFGASPAPRRPGDTTSLRKGARPPASARASGSGSPAWAHGPPLGRGVPAPRSRPGGSSVSRGFGRGLDRRRSVGGARSSAFPPACCEVRTR